MKRIIRRKKKVQNSQQKTITYNEWMLFEMNVVNRRGKKKRIKEGKKIALNKWKIWKNVIQHVARNRSLWQQSQQ